VGLTWRHRTHRLEKRVLAELRADPELWKEHKRLSKRDPGLVAAGAAGVAFMLLLYGVGVLSEETRAHQFNLVLWMLISTAAAFMKASTSTINAFRSECDSIRERLDIPV
jgi:hypothetical protein